MSLLMSPVTAYGRYLPPSHTPGYLGPPYPWPLLSEYACFYQGSVTGWNLLCYYLFSDHPFFRKGIFLIFGALRPKNSKAQGAVECSINILPCN